MSVRIIFYPMTILFKAADSRLPAYFNQLPSLIKDQEHFHHKIDFKMIL